MEITQEKLTELVGKGYITPNTEDAIIYAIQSDKFFDRIPVLEATKEVYEFIESTCNKLTVTSIERSCYIVNNILIRLKLKEDDR